MRTTLNTLKFTLILLFASAACAGPTFSFEQITNNSGSDAVEGQLSVELIDYGTNYVEFLFVNSGPLDSSITDIYFDDGDFRSIASIFGFAGIADEVLFSVGAKPANLSGGETYGFETSTGLSADSDSPHLKENGVNPNEQLGLILSVEEGLTYSDVLNDILAGDLTIGIHVQSIGEYSESFISTTAAIPPVPVPGAALLGGIGLSLTGWAGRNKIIVR